MKCPKCKYASFEYLDKCKRCGRDLTAHKRKFNIYATPQTQSLDIYSFLEGEKEVLPLAEQVLEKAGTVSTSNKNNNIDTFLDDEIDLNLDEEDLENFDKNIKIEGEEEIDLNLDDHDSDESEPLNTGIELENFLDTSKELNAKENTDSNDKEISFELDNFTEDTEDLNNIKSETNNSSVEDMSGESKESESDDFEVEIDNPLDLEDDSKSNVIEEKNEEDKGKNINSDKKNEQKKQESDDDILDFGNIDLEIDQ